MTMLDIVILKFAGPGDFWVREAPGIKSSPTTSKFHQIEARMQDVLNIELQDNVTIAPGQILAARKDRHKWYRVKVKHLLASRSGYKVDVWFLDYAESTILPVSELRALPHEFHAVPYQAMHCRLHGIQPQTLVISKEDLTTSKQPCKKWDESARGFIETALNVSTSAKLEVISVDKGVHHVKLYVRSQRQSLWCLNDELVNKDWAIETIETCSSSRSHSPSPSCSSRTSSDSEWMNEASDIKYRASPVSATGRISPEIFMDTWKQELIMKQRREYLGRGHDGNVFGSSHTSTGIDTKQMSPIPSDTHRMRRRSLGFDDIKQSPQPRSRHQQIDEVGSSRACEPVFNFPHSDPHSPALENISHNYRSPDSVDQEAYPIISLEQSNHRRSMSPMIVTPPSGRSGVTSLSGRGDMTSPSERSHVTSPSGRSGVTSSSGRSGVTSPSGRRSGMTSPNERRSGMTSSSGRSGVTSPSSSDSESARCVSPFETVQIKKARRPKYSPAEFKARLSPHDAMFSSSIKSKQSSTTQASGYRSGSPNISKQESGKLRHSLSPFSNSGEKAHQSDTVHVSDSETNSCRSVVFKEGTSVKEFQPTRYGQRSILPSPLSSPEAARKEASNVRSILKRRESGSVPAFDGRSNEADCILAGQLLLEELNVRSQNHQSNAYHSSTLPSYHMHRTPVTTIQAFVYGTVPIKPIEPNPVLESLFSPGVVKTLQEYDYMYLKLCQQYAWPAALRGRSFVCVSPKNGGKTAAYLCPVISQLADTANYEDLGPGNGPYVIILCSSWQKARDVYDHAENFRRNSNNFRNIVLYGGSAENKSIPLFNGCEILVATPHCLCRMLEKLYTNLKRLSHLVIDEADILTEQYTEPLKIIMKTYHAVLKQKLDDVVFPCQIMLFSRQWTKGIESFYNTYLVNPFIIMTCLTEASIFCEVHQRPHVVRTINRVETILGILNPSLTANEKVVIFTKSPGTTEILYKILCSESRYVFCAHEDMLEKDLREVGVEWASPHKSDSQPILVMTDKCLNEDLIKVTDATMLIHFDLTDSKGDFSCRMRAMFDNLVKQDSVCSSHILVTENDSKRAPHILELLNRINPDVTASLVKLARDSLQNKEECKSEINLSLCHYMKAYGECKEYATGKCPQRHLISRDFDLPGEYKYYNKLPTCGDIKVKVTFVHDATCFYGRITEYHGPDGKINIWDSTYVEIIMAVAMYYEKSANRKYVETAKLREVYGYVDSTRHNTYYRVMVCEIDLKQSQATVMYIDEGGTKHVPINKLMVLPDKLKNYAFQAVEIYACYMKPVDTDQEWTDTASRYVFNLTILQEIEGHIVMCLGNTFWLDPIVKRERLEEIKVLVNKWTLKRELIRGGFAIENPQHLEKLYKACEGRIDLPVLKMMTANKPGDEQETEKIQSHYTEQGLPLGEKYHNLYCSAVTNPGLFFMVRWETYNDLQDLMDQMNDFVSMQGLCLDEESVEIGDKVVCQFTKDNRWYRAEVIAHNGRGTYNMFFVDYGEREWHSIDHLKTLPKQFEDFPFQALECSLAHIDPAIGDYWSAASGDCFEDMMYYPNDENILLVAKVVARTPGQFCHDQHYLIELYDTHSQPHDLNLANQLIEKGHAVSHDFNPNVQEVSSGTMYDYKKIPSLCAIISKNRDIGKSISTAKKIHHILQNSTNFKDEIREENGLRCLCQLINLIINAELQDHLLLSIAFLTINNTRNVDYIYKEGTIDILCETLKTTKQENVQQNIAYFFRTLPMNEQIKKYVWKCGCVKRLVEILQQTDLEKVQENIIGAIANLDREPDRECKALDEDFLYYLISMLKPRTAGLASSAVIIEIMKLLTVLSSHTSIRTKIFNQGLIKILIDLLNCNEDEKIATGCMQLVLNLAQSQEGSGPFKTEMVRIINAMKKWSRDIASRNAETQQAFKDLLNLVDMSKSPRQKSPKSPKKPAQQFMLERNAGHGGQECLQLPLPDLPPLEVADDDDDEIRRNSVCPQVQWAEDRMSVLLSVQVIAAQSVMVRYTDKSVIFRCLSSNPATDVCTIYHFDLPLKSCIVPAKCNYAVNGTEVLIKLRKKYKGRWRHLSAEKVSWVSTDFSRFQDSSSDASDADIDSSDDENQMMKLRKLSRDHSGFGRVPDELKQKKDYYYDISDDSHEDDSDDIEYVEDKPEDFQ